MKSAKKDEKYHTTAKLPLTDIAFRDQKQKKETAIGRWTDRYKSNSNLIRFTTGTFGIFIPYVLNQIWDNVHSLRKPFLFPQVSSFLSPNSFAFHSLYNKSLISVQVKTTQQKNAEVKLETFYPLWPEICLLLTPKGSEEKCSSHMAEVVSGSCQHDKTTLKEIAWCGLLWIKSFSAQQKLQKSHSVTSGFLYNCKIVQGFQQTQGFLGRQNISMYVRAMN